MVRKITKKGITVNNPDLFNISGIGHNFSDPCFLQVSGDRLEGYVFSEGFRCASLASVVLDRATQESLKLFREGNEWIYFQIEFFPGRIIVIACPEQFLPLPYLEYLQNLLCIYLCVFRSDKKNEITRSVPHHGIKLAQLIFGNQGGDQTVGWFHPVERVLCVCHGFSTSDAVVEKIIPKTTSHAHYSLGKEFAAQGYLDLVFLDNMKKNSIGNGLTNMK